jgi:chemotaxis protein methyltransferase CheR
MDSNLEFQFTDEDFLTLSNIVTQYSGIELPLNKKALMYSRVVRRIRALHLDSFGAYIQKVTAEMKSNSEEELLALLNAMTTNVTHFFREQHHFDTLTEILPSFLEKHKKVRIWCCAASTGEEPWSIAMTVQNHLEKHPSSDIKIIATDIDHNVIEACQKATYKIDPETVKNHPLMKKYLHKTNETHNNPLMGNLVYYKVDPQLAKLITFKTQNLLHPWNLPETQYHIVFCRNVIIYFSHDTKVELFQKMDKLMPPGGQLFIGHSESLLNVSTAFKHAGRTTYTKVDHA